MRCNCVDVVKASLQAFYYDTSLNPYKGIAGRFRRLPQHHPPEADKSAGATPEECSRPVGNSTGQAGQARISQWQATG